MTDNKDNNILKVFVAFRQNDSVSIDKMKVKLGKILITLFEDYSFETSSHINDENEVIYMFQAPIMNSTETHNEFFLKMKRLFNSTEDYSPHFTQVHTIIDE